MRSACSVDEAADDLSAAIEGPAYGILMGACSSDFGVRDFRNVSAHLGAMSSHNASIYMLAG